MKYCDEYVCMSVCLCARRAPNTTRPNFTEFSEHVAYDPGSIFLWRRCDTLCTSGFVGDVILSLRFLDGRLLLWYRKVNNRQIGVEAYHRRRQIQRVKRAVIADLVTGLSQNFCLNLQHKNGETFFETHNVLTEEFCAK